MTQEDWVVVQRVLGIEGISVDELLKAATTASRMLDEKVYESHKLSILEHAAHLFHGRTRHDYDTAWNASVVISKIVKALTIQPEIRVRGAKVAGRRSRGSDKRPKR